MRISNGKDLELIGILDEDFPFHIMGLVRKRDQSTTGEFYIKKRDVVTQFSNFFFVSLISCCNIFRKFAKKKYVWRNLSLFFFKDLSVFNTFELKIKLDISPRNSLVVLSFG